VLPAMLPAGPVCEDPASCGAEREEEEGAAPP